MDTGSTLRVSIDCTLMMFELVYLRYICLTREALSVKPQRLLTNVNLLKLEWIRVFSNLLSENKIFKLISVLACSPLYPM